MPCATSQMLRPQGRLALVITTYERHDALAAVLASVSRQTLAPTEILIADDGSGPSTREVVDAFMASSAVPARHVSQPHAGFRVTRLRNLAIAATDMDYLVFIDGDMLLHPQFIADHARFCRRGFYTQGVRAHADARQTERLIADHAQQPGPWSPGFGGLRRAYLLHSPPLSSLTRKLANAFIAIKGCNQGFWRDDLVRVNGFNEAIEGWGAEDKELAARLENAGVRRQTLLFGGIASHLHHAPASRAALPRNLKLLDDAKRERRVRCDRGLDAHFRRGAWCAQIR
jgi:glycosyltransferase involved in cell wall biosynthesis